MAILGAFFTPPGSIEPRESPPQAETKDPNGLIFWEGGAIVKVLSVGRHGFPEERFPRRAAENPEHRP
jgi:hypothetical protein